MFSPSDVLVSVVLASRNTNDCAPCEFYALQFPGATGWQDIYIPRAAAWELARLGFGVVAD